MATGLSFSHRILTSLLQGLDVAADVTLIPTEQASGDLIATIEESLAIADEGKARRASAEKDLQEMEANLRDTLASAKAAKPASPAA